MPQPTLSIAQLPAWARLSNIRLDGLKVAEIPGKGHGLVATEELGGGNDGTTESPLLKVPSDAVVSRDFVDEHAKANKDFRELLEAVGYQSPRTKILLFLLSQLPQIILASESHQHGRVGSTLWAEYIKILTQGGDLLTPTLWSADERALLRGTSLESAVEAKMSSLEQEFEDLSEKISKLIFWDEILFRGPYEVTHRDWIGLDALYRSRCLELPRLGASLVPVLDMANHSSSANCLYQEDSATDDVTLILREGHELSPGDEATISYGDGKSGAEMLFSYGFIEPQMPSTSLTLPLPPLPDDPLSKVKAYAFSDPPTASFTSSSTTEGRGSDEASAGETREIQWHSPYAYFLCLNEEDGLDFRLLQDNAGGNEVRVFWLGEDVTGSEGQFDQLVRGHPLCEVFRLRVVVVLEELVSDHLRRMASGLSRAAEPAPSASEGGSVREECVRLADALKEIEGRLLTRALEHLKAQKTQLLADSHVVEYLGSAETTQSEQAASGAANEDGDDDFS